MVGAFAMKTLPCSGWMLCSLVVAAVGCGDGVTEVPAAGGETDGGETGGGATSSEPAPTTAPPQTSDDSNSSNPSGNDSSTTSTTGADTQSTTENVTASDGSTGARSTGTSGSDDTTGDGDTTGGDDTTGNTPGEPVCPANFLVFDDASFDYYSNQNGDVSASDGTELTLIPDEVTQAGVAVLHTQMMQPPYDVEFEFSIFDDDGQGSPFNSADGMAVMLLDDAGAYEQQSPPDGQGRGVLDDGSGYAVHFAIYGARQAFLDGTDGTALDGPDDLDPSIYSHGQWRSVRIEVREDRISVYYEDALALEHVGTIDTTHGAIGFGAGTGGADGQHQIRNVRICQ